MSVDISLEQSDVDTSDCDPTVVQCYSLFDRVFPLCGMLDYTEGIYGGDASVTLEDAQLRQIRYVLDQVRCVAGSRILDVGCGNGTLLDEVKRRGAEGTGITVSPEQVARCRRRGLDVRLLDYKLLSGEYDGRFDAVVCNGPIEHFVQPAQAAQGLAERIYRRMFEKLHRAIDPASSVGRFVSTTIHFVRIPLAEDLMQVPWKFARGSDAWHWAWLARSFGGWYPAGGQFERAASGYFDLIRTDDGTQDYRITSEEWLRRIRKSLRTPFGFKLLLGVVPFAVRHFQQACDMFICMLATESWNWQFRGSAPPTRLLRQTWQRLP